MGEECWLCFISDDRQVTDIAFITHKDVWTHDDCISYFIEAKRLSLSRIPLTRI